MATTPTKTSLGNWETSVVRARLVVAALGEAASPPWWMSIATTPSGGRMLARLFPRTSSLARFETSCRSAAAVHDQRVGNDRYHLFRLPPSDEASIFEALRTPQTVELLRELLEPERAVSEWLHLLEELDGSGEVPVAPGPLHCGNASGLRRGGTIQRMCSAYLGGFRSSKQVYPYIERAVRA